MKKININSFKPHVLAILLFIVISMVYLWPLLEGKRLEQGDIKNFAGMSKEIADYRESTGKEALWTNRMFSGMPAYQISVIYKTNFISFYDKAIKLFLPHPAGLVFLYFLGFYILLLVLGFDKRLGILGAIAFAFSSYFFIILDAGHNSKANAIGYMAPVIAGIILTFNGRLWLGGALTAVFLALEINANHLQITYYLALAIIILGIVEFISKYKEKELKKFFSASGVLIIALILSIGTNIANLWATSEYVQDSTRGKSELTAHNENKTSGLDKDYATDWSYGKMESFTLLIPNYMGGSSTTELSKNSNTNKLLKESGIPNSEKYIKNLPTYWGDPIFTSGPVYAGAIIVFLFILGLFIVKGKYKWWLLSTVILSLFLAWGRNMMWFTDVFFDFVPGYNKFRSVSMTLVIAELCIPLLAMLALKNIFDDEIPKKDKIKSFKYAGIITLGILIIFGFLAGSFLDFVSPNDAQTAKMYLNYGFPEGFMAAIQSDRPGMLTADTFRSLIFIVLAASVIWLYISKKLKNVTIVIAILSALVIIDMWTIDKRYLNDSNFTTKAKIKVPFTPTEADLMILQDKEPDYRVYNLTVNPFQDASTSYFHNSIGGYCAVKMKRYQELIEKQISKQNMNVINMLNTRYFITADSVGNPVARRNPNALGNAWFVDKYKLVANADSELNALSNFDPSVTAIIDKRFESTVSNYKNTKDTTATIKLISYKPNNLLYQSKTTKEQLAVFSEIYYNKGWNVYIDQKLTPYFRANYVLRAMKIPAGEHVIEWKFEPAVFYTGQKVSLTFNLLLIIVVIGSIFLEFRNKKPTI